MKFKVKNSSQILDLTEDNLLDMKTERLRQLSSLNEEDAKIFDYVIMHSYDLMKLSPYYKVDDYSNDPTGYLHEVFE